MHEGARNLRTAERYLLAPALTAHFGEAAVAVCDISSKGARFRHEQPVQTGMKSLLKFAVDGRAAPVTLEAVIVWSQPDPQWPGKFMSGCRTYGPPEVVQSLLAMLLTSHRTTRIEELRSTDRFYVLPALAATFEGQPAQIEDLSARGARLVLPSEPAKGVPGMSLHFALPDSQIDVTVRAQVVWTSVKAITGAATRNYRAGLFINEKAELMRLAIGHLCESNRAGLDTQSLRLKLKIIRARARQMAPSFRQIEESGIPAEQYLLIQGVREELRLNPEEAMHWYRRARIVINDPATRSVAPPIANHPDAIAVWEYLDRSVDPSIVGRAFELPLH
ncbi:MAG TPA: PilZ domain-containing protein [Thermoanaerobaculia bacterium]|nr:PilZ domain-containing protein [Thermoanaerobaculia bacterium]